ncbi:hypothetical protein ACS0TY_026327 [Phlomoides rotata]
MGHTIPEVAIVVALGIFAWTLVEYTLYRFRFHIKTKTYWAPNGRSTPCLPSYYDYYSLISILEHDKTIFMLHLVVVYLVM